MALLVLATFAALLLVAPGARAAVPITNFYAGPISSSSNCNAAGTGLTPATDGSSHSDFCIAYKVASPAPSGDDLSSQVIDTPRGFSGEPDRFPQCTDAQFNYAANTSNVSCPANSQMGEVTAKIRVATVLLGTQSLSVTGRVFNLQHSENEVARLGIILDPTLVVAQPKVKILVRVTLRPSPDVGLRSIIENLPKTANTSELVTNGTNRPLATDEFALTFWGSKANHPSMPRDFGMLGSDCSTPQNSSIKAVSYDGTPTSAAAAPYNLTNCNAAPFTPTAAFSTTENRPDVTTETSVKVKFGESTGALTSATAKKTVVTLPGGLSFSGQIASGANGLPLCTAEQFNHFGAPHSTCPDATAVGTVQFTSPLLSRTLNGKAFLGPQAGVGQLPDLYIEAEQGPAADAPRIKLVGKLTIDDQNRIVTTLDDLPQVLSSEFALTFRGGDQAAVVTPPTCGTTQGGLSATSYAGTPAVVTTQDYTVSADCDAVGAFTPTVAFGLANPNAGQSGAFTTTVSRPDRQQRLAKTVVDLPVGMLANLKGVPECLLADAAAGNCSDATKVGVVTAQAGVGPAPYSTDGAVYLTARDSGAVAGLSFKVPVAFGEVNLGMLNIPARIDIRQDDLGLRITADVPERFAGIPLNIRSMAINLNRANFPLNPTNCSLLTTTSQLTSTGGAVAPAPASLQVTNCGALPFDPSIDASVTGKTGYFEHPDLKVRVTSAPGSGALRQTYVTLPVGLAVDLDQIPRACKIADFKAGNCAATAKIGTVSGSLAITDDALTGDLYLTEPGPGTQLPGLGLAFTGRFSGRVLGANKIEQPSGRLITAFDALPDLPLTAFQLDIAGSTGGKANGPIVANKTLCTQSNGVVFNARFVAHSGPTVSKTATTSCGTSLGTAPKVSARLKGVRKGKPTLALTTSAPGTLKIKSVDVSFRTTYKLTTSKAKSRKYVKVTKLSIKSKKIKSKNVSSKKTSKLRITMPSGGSTRFRLQTKSGTYAIKRASVRKSKKKIPLTVKITYTDGKTATVAMKLTPH